MADHFPKGSVIRRVNLEPALLFGAGRALLMQLAHPSVADGVNDHSEFQKNPFKRLLGTLEATYAVVFGSEELARGVGRRIRWIHDFVVGPGYSANDPRLLMWVHATLVDTALRCYEELVEPLPEADREAYYQQMKEVAAVFGVALDRQPETLADFEDYLAKAMADMQVSAVGKELIGFILAPTLPLQLHRPLRPLLDGQRLFTLGLLPDAIRVQLDVPWTAADQARFERAQRRVGAVFRALPRSVRTAGNRLSGPALIAMATRHVRQLDARPAAPTPA